MRRIHILLMSFAIISLLILGCGKATNPVEVPLSKDSEVSSLAKAIVIHDDFNVPVDETPFSPCAGEFIHFTGAFHVVTQTTIDANGGFTTHFTANDHNLSGAGLTSGAKYRRVGATVNTVNIAGGGLPFEQTFTNTFNFIGQGSSNNTLLNETFHITITANGVTAFVDRFTLACK